MGNPNTTPPAPTPPPDSVLLNIFKNGANADLSHVSSNINVGQERTNAKLLTSEQREHLATQIEAWRVANRNVADTNQLKEKVEVLNLLQELKDDINPPALPRVASEIGSSIASIGHQSLEDIAVAGEKAINKVTGDAFGMIDARIPLSDKLITGAKYIIGAVGITAALSWLNKKWHDTTGKGWASHTFKWLGAIGLAMVGAKVVANTTDRSFGPRLSEAPIAPSPTVVVGKSAPAATSAPANPNVAPVEMEFPSFFKLKENDNYIKMDPGTRMTKTEFDRVVTELKKSKVNIIYIEAELEKLDTKGAYQKEHRQFIFKRTSAV